VTTTAAAFAAAAAFALVDWRAVWTRNRGLEYFAKPAVMVALIVAAATIDAASAATRSWFLIALVLSLAGDVFLMLEREQFIAGLSSFLLAHIAYIAGLLAAGVGVRGVLAGAVITIAAGAALGRRIVTSVRAQAPSLVAPVIAYILAISVMVMAATGTQVAAAAGGAVLFYASDAALAWHRFVQPTHRGRIVVIVPYHLGQALLVFALSVL
jgi:uncharacterized membrane protein YhhN